MRKGEGKFGGLWEHGSERILASDGVWQIASADEEDEAFLAWGRQYKFKGVELLSPAVAVASYLAYLKVRDVAEKSPIPGSRRWFESNNV